VGKEAAHSNSIRRRGNCRGDRNVGGAAKQAVERPSIECRHIVSISTTGAAAERVADSGFAGSADSAGNRSSSQQH